MGPVAEKYVPPVKYELGFYIPENDILDFNRRGNLKSYKWRALIICFEIVERLHDWRSLE
jgi:hypothetical protein